MGALADLIYFGPRLGPARAARLFTAKLRKRRDLRRLAAVLTEDESPQARARRLQLPEDPAARLSRIRERLSEACPAVRVRPGATEVARSRAVTRGRQMLFGSERDVGWPPRWDWRWDGDPDAAAFAADLRSTWEIQRLQGILPLARIAASTTLIVEREQAASSYLDAVVDFHRRHPGPGGVAWSSALELGLRLVALTQGLPGLADTEAFKLHVETVLEILDRHARWLRADLSLDKVVRGNHLLGELAGLTVAGHLLPEARPAWWDDLDPQDLLEKEILDQFHEDGVNVEQSLTYEKFILEFLAVAGRLARLRKRPFSPATLARLAAAAEHLRWCTGPDGRLPHVGDCDSGRGADFGDTDPDDPTRVLEAVDDLTGDAPADPGSGGGHPIPVGALVLRHFPQGGHAAARGPEAFLFLRGGRFGHGIPGPCSHSHADLLSPVLSLCGEPVLVDPGVLGYNVGPDRNAWRGWLAHNTLALEPVQPPYPAGLFRWRAIPPGADLRVEPEETGFRILGTMMLGSGRSPLLWHRVVRYNQLAESWSIRDSIQGNYDGPVTWAFHFAPGASLEPIEGAVRVRLESGTRYLLRLTPPGDVSLESGWIAPAYGRRRESPVAVRRLKAPFDTAEALLAPDPA